jgi:hypothetical protein
MFVFALLRQLILTCEELPCGLKPLVAMDECAAGKSLEA